MKYLCLIYHDEKKFEALSEREYDALVDEALAYDVELRTNGHGIVAEALEPEEAVTTLKIDKGRVSITDGPFAETKEQLGGFFLIEASDLNEAIQIASKIPPLRMGAIEVRPIKDIRLGKEKFSNP